jgi:3-oxoacyl-[acyl-carrier protein] reductase
MDLGLQGKTAVITGGSKGIGFAIAEEFAREGVSLHLAARSGDDLKRAASDLTSRYAVGVKTHPVDLADRNVRDAFARECAHVDILVNCAGAIPGGALDQVSEDAWRAAWDLKLFGYIGITRIIYDEMCRRRRGGERAPWRARVRGESGPRGYRAHELPARHRRGEDPRR